MITFYKLEQYPSKRVTNCLPVIEQLYGVQITSKQTSLLLRGDKEATKKATQHIKWEEDNYWRIGWCFHNRKYNKAIKLGSFSHIDVSNFKKETIKQTIGRKGCYFIAITERLGLNAIWHNRGYKTIELWGDAIAISQAKEEVLKKLYEYQ